MGALGAVGRVVDPFVLIRSRRALMATGAILAGAVDLPDFTLVETPVPSAGLNAFVFQGPGTRTWQAPVNAGTVTVAVKMRKDIGYGSEQLPYLELVSEDQRIRSTMPDTTGSYVTVSASITIREDNGVLDVTVVRPWPTYGSNFSQVFLSASEERRRINPGALYLAELLLI